MDMIGREEVTIRVELVKGILGVELGVSRRRRLKQHLRCRQWMYMGQDEDLFSLWYATTRWVFVLEIFFVSLHLFHQVSYVCT